MVMEPSSPKSARHVTPPPSETPKAPEGDKSPELGDDVLVTLSPADSPVKAQLHCKRWEVKKEAATGLGRLFGARGASPEETEVQEEILDKPVELSYVEGKLPESGLSDEAVKAIADSIARLVPSVKDSALQVAQSINKFLFVPRKGILGLVKKLAENPHPYSKEPSVYENLKEPPCRVDIVYDATGGKYNIQLSVENADRVIVVATIEQKTPPKSAAERSSAPETPLKPPSTQKARFKEL